MPLKAIAAMASNRVIGRQGALPWRLPEELKWFKRLTLGHPVVMGRKTMESLGGRPLPGRRNLVLSRALGAGGLPPGFELAPGNPEALAALADTVFIIGGAAVYEEFLPECEELYLSHVRLECEGDAWFPPFEDRFELAEILADFPEFELRRYRRRA